MKKWLIEGQFDADVEKVDAEIKSIGERVKPEDLVNFAAENEESELHKCFEWDDTVAAGKYRIYQAQKLLTFIVNISDKSPDQRIREYSLTTERSVYAPTRMFLTNEEEYSHLLKQALSELKAFERKYKNLTELDSVFAEIDKVG